MRYARIRDLIKICTRVLAVERYRQKTTFLDSEDLTTNISTQKWTSFFCPITKLFPVLSICV